MFSSKGRKNLPPLQNATTQIYLLAFTKDLGLKALWIKFTLAGVKDLCLCQFIPTEKSWPSELLANEPGVLGVNKARRIPHGRHNSYAIKCQPVKVTCYRKPYWEWQELAKHWKTLTGNIYILCKQSKTSSIPEFHAWRHKLIACGGRNNEIPVSYYYRVNQVNCNGKGYIPLTASVIARGSLFICIHLEKFQCIVYSYIRSSLE